MVASSSSSTSTDIVVVGAGPSGLLLAHYLLKRYATASASANTPSSSVDSQKVVKVTILERRPDPRRLGNGDNNSQVDMRSFPIALNSRGLESLRTVGLLDKVEQVGVYLDGICLHTSSSKAEVDKPKIIKRDKPSLSVDRNRLTLCLLEELMETSSEETTKVSNPEGTVEVSIRFDTIVDEIVTSDDSGHRLPFLRVRYSNDKAAAATATAADYKDDMLVEELNFSHLVAADGGRSKIRQHLIDNKLVESTIKDIPDEYKSIFLQRSSEDGSLKLDDKSLHGWMFSNPSTKLISAPVVEGCVSGAFIFDKGMDPFSDMKNEDDVLKYFQEICPSSLGKEGIITREEASQLLSRPVSTLVSVRCNQLHAFLPLSSSSNSTPRPGVLLLGDAGHAVSASAGQGCNSALQDVQVFMDVLEKVDGDWGQALPKYTDERIEDAHAVSDLSDYCNPRTKLMKFEWIFRIILRKLLPTWLAYYVLRPMPMELLMESSLPYREVLSQTRWWVDRVKSSMMMTDKTEINATTKI